MGFFSLTKKKVILFFILLAYFWIFQGYIMGVAIIIDQIFLLLHYINKILFYPLILLIKLSQNMPFMMKYFIDMNGSLIWPRVIIAGIIGLVIMVVYIYFISCLFIWIYEKIKNRKKR